MKKLLHIFYIFNFVEWPILIFLLYLVNRVWRYTDETVVRTGVICMFILCAAVIVVFHYTKDLNEYNLHKYRFYYKVKHITVNNNTCYVPIVVIWSTFGHRYERIIDNSRFRHLSDYTPYKLMSMIKENNYAIPPRLSEYCFRSEEVAYYEIVKFKNYITDQKIKKQGTITSKEINVNFKS